VSVAVSVVMPCFNEERYIAQAVQSIIDQSFTDFELLAVDDGSADSTLRILERFAGSDARIRVVRQEHAGLVAALHAGVDVASGRFLARMDADDVAWPTRFARQFQVLENDPGLAGVGSWARAIDAEGNALEVIRRPPWDALRAGFGKSPILHPTSMFRRDAYRAVGGYRPAFEIAEDLDLWLRMLEHGFRLTNLQEVLLDYRYHGSNVSGVGLNGTAARARVLLSQECRRRRIADPLHEAGRQPAGSVPWDLFPRDLRSSIRIDFARSVVLRGAPALSDEEHVRSAAELRGAFADAGLDSRLFEPILALSKRSAERGEFLKALIWLARAVRCSPRQALRRLMRGFLKHETGK
jgi:glycosyltransferase involved in cell wall biosynthesis